mgnify:CR=1 FL=1
MATIHDCITGLTPEGMISYWSPGAERVYGFSPREALGQDLHQLLRTRCVTSLETIRNAVRRDGRWEGEWEQLHKEGATLHLDYRITLEGDRQGGPLAILAVGRLRPEPAGQAEAGPAGAAMPETWDRPLDPADRGLEERLRQANQKIADILGNVSDGFVSLNREWRYTFVNEAGARMLGTTAPTLLGKPLLDAFPGVERTRFWTEWNRSVAENSVCCFEEFYAPLGRWYECRCYPSAAGLTVFFSDTTERRHAAEALRASEGRYRALVDLAPDAIIAHQDGRFVYANAVALELYHASAPDQLLGRKVLDLIHPDDRELVRQRMRRAAVGQKVPLRQLRLLRLDGRAVQVEATSVAIEFEGKAAVQVIIRDVTLRLQAEETLRQAKERLELAQIASRAGTWDWDVASGQLEWSPRLFELFGFDPETAPASFETWERALHPEDRAIAGERIQRSLRDDTMLSSEYRIIKPDGQVRWIHALGRGKYDERGAPVRMTGICLDITERKRMEESLEESKRLLDSLMDCIPEGITIADATSARIRMVSRRGREMLGDSHEGASVQEIASKWKVFHQDGRTPLEAAEMPLLRALFRGETLNNFEITLINSSGQLLTLSCNAAPIRDRDGAIVGAINAWRDVGELKAAENELRASETRFRALFNGMTEGFALHEVICDARGEPCDYRFLDVNPSFERLTGSKREDVVGKTVRQLLPGENPVWINNYGQVALTGRPMHFEDFSPVLQRYFEVYAYSPAPRQFAVLFMDTTHRKQLEAEKLEFERLKLQAESQKQWQATFDCITDLISIHGWDGSIRRANRAFLEYFGVSNEAVLQRKCFQLFHDSIQPPKNCPMGQTRSSAKPCRTEITDPRTSRILEISTFPLIAPDGTPDGCIHLAKDVTSRKQDEMRFIMNNRLASLGQMAAGIAHEINNPLATISGCAEGLMKRINRGVNDPELFNEYFRIIDEEIFRCKRITSSMLSFARTPDPNRQVTDLNEILDRTLEMFGFQGRLHQVDLMKTLHPGGLPVRVVEVELKQVFTALLANALDAIHNQGHLEISTGITGEKVWARISDSGPGIPAEIITQIFDPFFTTKQASGGTGLGLSLARKIIQSLKGSMEVESPPGRGAIFTVFLPAAADSPPEE